MKISVIWPNDWFDTLTVTYIHIHHTTVFLINNI
jgi:hypothetical protein